MKKAITLSLISVLVLSTPTIVAAQGVQQGQAAGTQQRIQDPTLRDETISVSPQGQAAGQGQAAMGQAADTQAAGMYQGIGRANESLTRVAERSNNPEIGQQLRVMTEEHQEIQTKTQTAMKNMSQRNTALKFFLGPDYKNAGEVRSNLVNLRNDISKLETLKETANEEDMEDIDAAITELKAEADSLDTQLEEELSGFSLFGWLAQRLAN
jgi:hypothetical protein